MMEHISLDGFIAPPGDDDYANGGWTAAYRSPEGAAAVGEAQGDNFDLLLGRTTYDLWSRYWPKMEGGPFADKFNAATKYVVTHRSESLAWGPVGDLGKDAIEGIRELRTQNGPDLLIWGSSTVTTVLVQQGLVDELVLAVYPVLLGGGKRCFAEGMDIREFALVSSKASPTGMLLNTYRHVGSLRKP